MTIDRSLIAKLSPQEKRALLAKILQEKLNKPQTFPLSFAQARLWVLEQLEPGTLAYNLLIPVGMTGQLNKEAWKQALNAIVERHEILRTTFTIQDGKPLQEIHPTLKLNVPVIDLRSLPIEQQLPEVQRLAKQEASKPFDLAKGPLLRVTLLKLEETNHVILLAYHHIISDGWSMDVLLRELTTIYDSFSREETYALPPLPVQYADFAVWQRKWLRGEVLETQLNYWKQQFKDISNLPSLPTDRGRPQVRSFKGTKHSFVVAKSLTEKLKKLSQREGVTFFMTMLTTFKTLLYYYSQQTDIRVGTPIANRDRPEIAGLIGFFVNSLVLRTDLSENPSFKELLQRVKKVALGAYAHQDLPFEKLVEELNPERSLGQNPLFQVWFYLQNDLLSDVEFRDLTLKVMEVDTGVCRHDLKLGLGESEGELKGNLDYSVDLFEAETIARLVKRYLDLLKLIVEQPDISLDELTATLVASDRQEQIDKGKQLQKTSFQKLKQIKRKTVRG